MRPRAWIGYAGLPALCFVMACSDSGVTDANAADAGPDSVDPSVNTERGNAADPSAAGASSAARLATLPRQIRDYHQTNYVDDCTSFENSTLTVREPGYVTSADFNGDGRPDYVLSGTHLDCSAGASYVCGNGTCPFDMFLSQGDGFTKISTIGHEGALIQQGGKAVFMVTSKSGQVSRLGPAPPGSAKASAADQAITVNVTLSPAARAAFARTEERVVIKAHYWGEAKGSYSGEFLDEMGGVDLGSDAKFLTPTGGQAVLDGSGVNQAALPYLNGPAEVRITVWTDRDTYLSCELDGTIADLSKRPHSLNCDLAR